MRAKLTGTGLLLRRIGHEIAIVAPCTRIVLKRVQQPIPMLNLMCRRPVQIVPFIAAPGIVPLNTLHPSSVYTLVFVFFVMPLLGRLQYPSKALPVGTPGVPGADWS